MYGVFNEIKVSELFEKGYSTWETTERYIGETDGANSALRTACVFSVLLPQWTLLVVIFCVCILSSNTTVDIAVCNTCILFKYF